MPSEKEIARYQKGLEKFLTAATGSAGLAAAPLTAGKIGYGFLARAVNKKIGPITGIVKFYVTKINGKKTLIIEDRLTGEKFTPKEWKLRSDRLKAEEKAKKKCFKYLTYPLSAEGSWVLEAIPIALCRPAIGRQRMSHLANHYRISKRYRLEEENQWAGSMTSA